MSEKRILLYGDSITWGRNPKNRHRYDKKHRLVNIIQSRLGKNYDVIEEGLWGRMMRGPNPNLPARDGLEHFRTVLDSHRPLFVLVIALGTNDMQKVMNKSADEIVQGLESYFQEINSIEYEEFENKPEILIVSPPKIVIAPDNTQHDFAGSLEKQEKLTSLMELATQEHGAYFVNGSNAATGSTIDGVHLDQKSTKRLAEFITDVLEDIIDDQK